MQDTRIIFSLWLKKISLFRQPALVIPFWALSAASHIRAARHS